jgi:hypothetical protein
LNKELWHVDLPPCLHYLYCDVAHSYSFIFECRLSKDLLLSAILICRNEIEKILIESGVSTCITLADAVETILCHEFNCFLPWRATT